MKKLEFIPTEHILVLAPHPDDESIGCAGVLMNFSKQCDVVVLTDGRNGGLAGEKKTSVIAKRNKEFKKAMNYININSYSFLDVEDGKLSKNFSKFSNLKFNHYDVIFCPSPGDSNLDHACVYDFLKKINFTGKIYFYEVWSTIKPTHFIDISSLVKRKKNLISHYKSQLKQVNYSSRIIGLNHFHGLLTYPAIDYAEVYSLV